MMDQTKKTTLLGRRENMPHRFLHGCHGGAGDLDFTEILNGSVIPQQCHLSFIHDDILPPGVSIGDHHHQDSEEYYYVISGRGTMTLDGEKFAVKAGDITAVFPGGTHGLENDTSEDLRIVVIGIRCGS